MHGRTVGFGHLPTQLVQLLHQAIDLLLLSIDHQIQLVEQVFGEAGLDLEFGQAGFDGCHSAIGPDLA